MSNPLRIIGPAVINFSGGRTSGRMLHAIHAAHGGKLPDDVVVCFANTGREMPGTLDFVRDCEREFNDVFAFWQAQTFDLRLSGRWEGNCYGCFLKGQPEMRIFRADREDYATLLRVTRQQGVLPFDMTDDAVPCDMAGCGV
jgi:3'-phosphoadenosine 5'-phosphosulfate sulfotransferase (PAPS reductase)/FAD synthetase